MKKISMKSILLLCLGLLFVVNIYSQEVKINDVNLSDIDSEYVQIVGVSKLLSSKITIKISYGQPIKLMDNRTTDVKVDGKRMEFNSMVDALNFMHKYNYEFVTAYAVTVGQQNVYHMLLRKL